VFKKSIHYFLYRVDSADDLPREIASLVLRYLPDYDGIIVIPPQDYPVLRTGWLRALPFGWRTTPARTLAFGRQHIVIVEAAPHEEPRTIVVPLADLLYSELAVDLLYAYLRLVWAGAERQHILTAEFNTTGMRILRQHFDRARAGIGADGALPVLEPGGVLGDLPLKFHNYTHYALLPDERVEAAVFQPAPRHEGRWRLTAPKPARSFTQTDRNLIIIEEMTAWPSSNYGLVTRLIPRRQVRGVAWEQDADGQRVCLTLGAGAGAAQMRYLVSEENTALWRATPAEHRAPPAAGR
jgi:hypothetical protein